MQSTPLLGVPTPEISKAGNELLCCCTTRQVRSCDRFCIKDLVRVYVIWQGLLYVLLFAFGGYLLSDQSPSKFVYCPEITAKVSCFHTRTASTPTDCYDAVTVVMGIVLVVMAMVMMGGAVYIGHCWPLIGSISGTFGSCCCNCCMWFLCGPWALHKKAILLNHRNLNEGVLLGPMHDLDAV
ncbi:TPA: hypothetical protein ACH3X3_003146 [Trebouxia sp. C0006]